MPCLDLLIIWREITSENERCHSIFKDCKHTCNIGMAPKDESDISNCFLGGKYKRDGAAAVEKQCKFAPAMIHLMMGFDIETEWSICSLIPTHLSKSYPSFRVQLQRSLLPDTYAGSSSPAITGHTPIPFVC